MNNMNSEQKAAYNFVIGVLESGEVPREIRILAADPDSEPESECDSGPAPTAAGSVALDACPSPSDIVNDLWQQVFAKIAPRSYDFIYTRSASPKSSVHATLLAPDRLWMRKYDDLTILSDPVYLPELRQHALTLACVVVAELSIRFGLQNGRNWVEDLQMGVQAVPEDIDSEGSAPEDARMLVHVMSRDLHGPGIQESSDYSTHTPPKKVENWPC